MGAKTAGRTRRVTRPSTVAGASPETRATDAPHERMPNLPDWRWRSFPVLVAFIAGVLFDAIINPPQSNAAIALRIVALLGAGYCLAHVFVVNTIVARRIKARQKAMAAAGDEDDEWVDEVVHPDELPAAGAGQSRTEPHLTR
jgi:alkylhydroperoxidase family enzyme